MKKSIIILILLCMEAIVFAQSAPLSPSESMSKMTLPAGYKIELFVSEPAITNVIDWTWDHKGRLWVSESVDYPDNINNSDPVNGGNDAIKIIEDTNGDGRADKVTVFATGLNIPVGIAPTEKGVLVNVSGSIWHLEDTNGDDKADKKTKLYDGFNERDTHVQENSIRYGLDNKYWVGHGGTPGQFKGIGPDQKDIGVFHFKIGDASYTDVTRYPAWGNLWGLGFDETGDVFHTDAGGSSYHITIPQRFYDKIPQGFRGQEKIISGGNVPIGSNIEFWAGGLKTAGSNATSRMSTSMNADVYSARLFPGSYHNKMLFQCNPGSRIVHQVNLVFNGSTYRGTSNSNLITSTDSWFAPLRATAGPDGAVWVMDLYNTNIGHNEDRNGDATYRQSQYLPGNAVIMTRDKTRGRIYRITPTTPREVDPAPSLNVNDISQLVNVLRHDNRFWRLTAQRLLTYKTSKKQQVVDAILPTLQYENRSGELHNLGTIHALWTLHGLGVIEENVNSIYPLLRHPSDAVVSNVVQVLPKNQATVNAIRDAKVLEDMNPGLRLKTLLLLSDMPNNVSGNLTMRSNDKTLDHYAIDGVAMAGTKVTIGNASNGGNRVSNLTLTNAGQPDFVSVSTEKAFRNVHSVIYIQSNTITGNSFERTERGVVSFYSVQGNLLGTRTLVNNSFIEGPLVLDSHLAFYQLQSPAKQVSGKVIRIN